MPVTDAKACGMPTMCVDYSAMEDHAHSPGGIPIKVQRYFYEGVTQTEQRRALPDNDDFCTQLTKLVKMDALQLRSLSQKARDYITELDDVYGQTMKLPRFGWDRTTAIWKNVIKEIEVPSQDKTWLCPDSLAIVSEQLDQAALGKMNNVDFVNSVIRKVWKRPELVNSFFANELIKALNTGFRTEGMNRIPFTRQNLVEMIYGIVNNHNQWEASRQGMVQKPSHADVPYGVV